MAVRDIAIEATSDVWCSTNGAAGGDEAYAGGDAAVGVAI